MKIPFSKIREEGQFKEIFLALERGFTKFGIKFYLVGATARDVWMKGFHDLPPKRATGDIDFGIMIRDSSDFDETIEYSKSLISHIKKGIEEVTSESK